MEIPQATSLRERVLRRRVIIREYDYTRLERQALGLFFGHTLYDRANFTPLTRDSLEKAAVVLALKGDPKWHKFSPPLYPVHFLGLFKDFLYDQDYLKWTVTWDEQGSMWVQARKNTPRTRLGWAVLEKDMGRLLS